MSILRAASVATLGAVLVVVALAPMAEGGPPQPLTQTTPFVGVVEKDVSANFQVPLSATGTSLPINWTESTPPTKLTISSAGVLSAAHTLTPGVYDAKGRISAGGGAFAGKWEFSLTVVAAGSNGKGPEQIVVPPPLNLGCAEYLAQPHKWRQIACLTAAEMSRMPTPSTTGSDTPDPLLGVSVPHTAKSVLLTDLTAQCVSPAATSSDPDPCTVTDNTWGPGAYSLQDNVYFQATHNGAPSGDVYAVQFTNQVCPSANAQCAGVGENSGCVWNIDVSTQQYNNANGNTTDTECVPIPNDATVEGIEGYVKGTGSSAKLTLVAKTATTGITAYKVTVNDLYNLGTTIPWTAVTGDLLGSGDGSALKVSSHEIWNIQLLVSDCLAKGYGGFITGLSPSLTCNPTFKFNGATTVLSPADTLGAATTETNNLADVKTPSGGVLKLPTMIPPSACLSFYAAGISYDQHSPFGATSTSIAPADPC